MFKKVMNMLKEAKRFVDTKIEVCKEVFSSANNRIIIGIIILGVGIGLGGSLITSGYVRLPN